MSSRDRFPRPCVSTPVRLVLPIALALAACPKDKAATTPTQPGPTADAGPLVAPPPSGRFEADAGIAPQDVDPIVDTPAASQPATQPTKVEGPKKPDPPKPPGMDLPPERVAAIVADSVDKGRKSLAIRDADNAIRAARTALDADETSVEAMVILGHGYYLKGFDDKAEAVLNIALKRPEGPRHPTLQMLLGLIYDRTAREDKALAAYEETCRLKPDYVAAQINRGAIYLKRKRYVDAVAVFEYVVKLEPKNARIRTDLGSAYRGRSADYVEQPEARGDLLRKAELEFKTSMTYDPTYPAAYFNIGILYLDADPFPGLETLARLQNAIRFLNQYKTVIPAGKDTVRVDEYLAAAQKAFDNEQKRLERQRKKDEAKKKKDAEAGSQPASQPGGAP